MVDRGEMESRSEASMEQRERKYEDREVAIVRIPYFLFFFLHLPYLYFNYAKSLRRFTHRYAPTCIVRIVKLTTSSPIPSHPITTHVSIFLPTPEPSVPSLSLTAT
jgi:hypothetical protein